MDEKDRWSIHVEYLKTAIALATALIAAGAAIYVDASKIPVDSSRYFLLAAVGVFFSTLTFSAWSMGLLGTHLAGSRNDTAQPAAVPAIDTSSMPSTTPISTTAPVTPAAKCRAAINLANASFFSLIIGAALLGVFFRNSNDRCRQHVI